MRDFRPGEDVTVYVVQSSNSGRELNSARADSLEHFQKSARLAAGDRAKALCDDLSLVKLNI